MIPFVVGPVLSGKCGFELVIIFLSKCDFSLDHIFGRVLFLKFFPFQNLKFTNFDSVFISMLRS